MNKILVVVVVVVRRAAEKKLRTLAGAWNRDRGASFRVPAFRGSRNPRGKIGTALCLSLALLKTRTDSVERLKRHSPCPPFRRQFWKYFVSSTLKKRVHGGQMPFSSPSFPELRVQDLLAPGISGSAPARAQHQQISANVNKTNLLMACSH